MLPEHEERIGTMEAARLLGCSRQSVVDKIVHGGRGIRLEAVNQGGRWKTSREAVRRYEARCTSQAIPEATASPTDKQAAKRLATARAALKEAGWGP